MRTVLAIAALALAGCGSTSKPKPPVAPRYPGATGAHTTGNASFRTTDWALPAGARPSMVYDWYTRKLQALGWKITQRNETGVHAEKGERTLDIGVRGQTIEAIAG